jgi:hypothetical protein
MKIINKKEMIYLIFCIWEKMKVLVIWNDKINYVNNL